MGQLKIEITAVGPHGCDRSAVEGQKLFKRCGRLSCVDCLTLDFVQTLRQKGLLIVNATLVHFAGSDQAVVDDLATNTRARGQFKLGSNTKDCEVQNGSDDQPQPGRPTPQS